MRHAIGLTALGLLMLCGCSTRLPDVLEVRPELELVPEDTRFVDTPVGSIKVAEARLRTTEARAFASAQSLEIAGIVRATRMEQYLDELTNRLLAPYPEAVAPRSVRIIASEQLNAFATGEGDLFVTLGLIDNVATESQLAAILAHELGHLELDHLDRIDLATSTDQMMQKASLAGTLGLTLAGTHVNARGGSLQVEQKDPTNTQENVSLLLASGWMIRTIGADVLNTNWSRQQEQQADLFALDTLVAAGMDPMGLPDILQVFAEQTAQAGTFADRLQASVEARDAQIETSFQADPIGYAKALAANRGAAMVLEAHRTLNADHPSPADRQTWANLYLERTYPDYVLDMQQIEQDEVMLTRARDRGFRKGVLKDYRQAFEANRQILAGDADQAAKTIAPVLRGPIAQAAYPRYVAFLIEQKRGRIGAAYRHLDAIGANEFKPLEVVTLQVERRITGQRYDEATRLLDQAAAQFGTDVPFYPQYISLAAHQKDEATARSIHERCRQVVDNVLRLGCDEALAPLGLDDVTPAADRDLLEEFGKAISQAIGM